MHFSSLLVASALCLTPAVYGYGVAQVTVKSHEDCDPGAPANDKLIGDAETTYATEDTCEKAKISHSLAIDAYSVSLQDVTKDTSERCHGLGVYANDQCIGVPNAVVPFYPGQEDAESECIPDDPFDKYVYVRLLCDGGDGNKDDLKKVESHNPAEDLANDPNDTQDNGGGNILGGLGLGL
ncbi:protein ccpA [Aspergillus luchuensis]|uniref:Uncharacterized protein n=3 Tax=Aspergillus subgen. Circumdati TaxID=2720871 RepID=A0A8G1RA96_9EURO|nr:hypothetical protein BO85DRAFT_485079 [Aspergillus piperis CBS 112811]XP_041540854.1 uncharacterized protein AKAW2_30407A [Aspergillus luchuensis]OJZ88516.1 hypothetical protein ASPFODRAFT_44208 [Aspergillus luchuensis CBS 106.47]GAA88608.1 similar to An08g06730 [Aspergillus luchuensis IFO 4308]RAH61347.1 hypothetical protein BO85DRAFT_485079 [Aspergillus piperis CBS 112811]BCR97088.1 hypothetical protein AKAW2_30407A [Aspergillus luchuensis]BCS09562.1 hypothetical protein ALUC_30379A [Asp